MEEDIFDLSPMTTEDNLKEPQNDPLRVWNDDSLVTSYLGGVAERKRGTVPDHALLQSRLRMLRVRMHELESLRSCLKGRVSESINRELASIYYKHKLLCWLTFPILDLPAEILGMIFDYVLYTTPNPRSLNLHRLRLTWVCKRFREVAVSHQTLWSTIWFLDSAPWARSFTFLERAGTAPLDLRIDDEEARENKIIPERITRLSLYGINYVLDRLLPKISQIRTLVFYCVDIHVVNTIITRLSSAGYPASLERLEIIRLHVMDDPWMPDWFPWGGLMPNQRHRSVLKSPPLLIAHPTAPKLRWLMLSNVYVNWSEQPMFRLKSINLRRLTSTGWPTSAQWTRMLTASAPVLTRLLLDEVGVGTPPPTSSRVHLPELRELILRYIPPDTMQWAVAHIHAPHITELNLAFHERVLNIIPFIEETIGLFPEVRVLTLVFTALEYPGVESIGRWFRAMPRLKVLKAPLGFESLQLPLTDPEIYLGEEELAVYIKKQEKGEAVTFPIVCPELEVLYLESEWVDDFIPFAEARMQLGAPLKKVYFVWKGEQLPQDQLAVMLQKCKQHVGEFLLLSHPVLSVQEEESIHKQKHVGLLD